MCSEATFEEQQNNAVFDEYNINHTAKSEIIATTALAWTDTITDKTVVEHNVYYTCIVTEYINKYYTMNQKNREPFIF